MKRQNPPFDGPGSGDGPGASRHRRGEVGFDRWLKARLHHTFDSVLEEKVPDDLMQLLQAFDAAPADAAPGMEGPGEGESPTDASKDDQDQGKARPNGKAVNGKGSSGT